MRKWLGLLLSTLVALTVVAGALVAGVTASASPSQTYSGTHFGDLSLIHI